MFSAIIVVLQFCHAWQVRRWQGRAGGAAGPACCVGAARHRAAHTRCARRGRPGAAQPSPPACPRCSSPQAATVVAAVLCFFAGLEAFLNFCAGCWFFGHAIKLKIVPDSVCARLPSSYIWWPAGGSCVKQASAAPRQQRCAAARP